MYKYTFQHSGGIQVAEVASCWKDVTFDQFLELSKLPVDAEIFQRISILSGIPVDIIKQCDTSNMLILSDQMGFSFDYTEVNEAALKYDKEKWDKWYIGDDEVIKYEIVRQAIRVCDKEVYEKWGVDKDEENLTTEFKEALTINRMNAAPVILKQYADIDTSKTSVLDCYGLVGFFLFRLENFRIGSKNLVIGMLSGKNLKQGLKT